MTLGWLVGQQIRRERNLTLFALHVPDSGDALNVFIVHVHHSGDP